MSSSMSSEKEVRALGRVNQLQWYAIYGIAVALACEFFYNPNADFLFVYLMDVFIADN